MFYAINSKTGESVNSLNLESNQAYGFIKDEKWFADVDEIESCPKEINVEQIEVKFREGSTDIISPLGKKYAISAHFFIPNKTKLGINTVQESKEHKLAKNWIYNRLIKPNQDKFLINYSKLNKGQHFNQFNLLDLPIDYSKIDVETNSSLLKKTRRADIICPFIVRHPILGNGVVFEIQFSKQKNKTKEERELDWAIRGYSIAWLYKDDFEYLTEKIIETKRDSIDVESFANLIKENKKEQVKQLKFTVQEETRKINKKIQDLKEEINEITQNSINQIQKEYEIKLKDLINISFENLIEEEFNKLKKNLQPNCPACGSKLKTVRRKKDNKVVWCCPNSCKDGWMEVLD